MNVIGELVHFGVLGMKWGVRKRKDTINSRDRVIKRGTEIQNISSRQLDTTKMRRLYTSYTQYDKDSYVDLMGNFMYDEKGYKNTFLVKKDLRVPSDRRAVEIFMQTVKENPKQAASDMAKAYNAQHYFARTTDKSMARKISSLDDPNSKRTQKIAKEFMSTTILDAKAKTSADNFYANLIKNGYDAISDVNDRDGGMQDPIVVVNMKSIQNTGSVKLTRKDLDYYSDYTAQEKHTSRRKDLSGIQT